jgi:hypothetical protein
MLDQNFAIRVELKHSFLHRHNEGWCYTGFKAVKPITYLAQSDRKDVAEAIHYGQVSLSRDAHHSGGGHHTAMS